MYHYSRAVYRLLHKRGHFAAMQYIDFCVKKIIFLVPIILGRICEYYFEGESVTTHVLRRPLLASLYCFWTYILCVCSSYSFVAPVILVFLPIVIFISGRQTSQILQVSVSMDPSHQRIEGCEYACFDFGRCSSGNNLHYLVAHRAMLYHVCRCRCRSSSAGLGRQLSGVVPDWLFRARRGKVVRCSVPGRG